MNKGFSLLELSIVLVIIGLIAGGIVAGSAMIRAAELRAVLTEYQQYQTATHTFRDKYLGLPGDIRNANAFWTDATDGDGNGTITMVNNSGSNGDMDFEMFGFWEQLALAELISGTYDGQSGPTAGWDSDIGDNVPASKLSGAGWAMKNDSAVDFSSAAVFEGTYGVNLRFGAEAGNTLPTTGIISPEELWNLDTKIDDGKPGRGNIRAREASTNCHTAGTSTTLPLADVAEYNLTSTDSSACSAIFLLK